MSRKGRLAGCLVSATVGICLVPNAWGGNLILNDVYHAQTTSYTCAIASIEMQLDIPKVTNGNAFVKNLLGTGDGNFVAIGAAPTPNTAQAYIYNMVHSVSPTIANNTAYNNANGQANLNAAQFLYNNPFINPVPGSGSDLNSLQFAANVLDNPGTAGLGNDAYTSFNVASGYYASRTIAAALQDTNIPAVIAVNHGTHAISVFGVNTTGVPARNGQYTINGFFVHDPGTGYVLNAPLGGKKLSLGIGINTYLRYGYDKPVPGAQDLTLPDGVTQATVSKLSWFNYFNLSGGQGAPTVNQLYQTGGGYKFQVEPQGPEALDTGGPDGSFNSLPTLTDLLPTPLDKTAADNDAAPDLAADGLDTEAGFENGSWDMADSLLLPDPTDPTAEGDWLVPYDGGSGTDDVTGMIAIDEATGVIDQATWFDPTDPIQSMTLADMQSMFTEDMDGFLPDDNPDVPEPMSAAFIAPAAVFLLTRRRRGLA